MSDPSRRLEDWEHHVRRTRVGEEKEVWCGAPFDAFRWDFVNIDHIANHRLTQGRLLPCPECLQAIVAALRSQ